MRQAGVARALVKLSGVALRTKSEGDEPVAKLSSLQEFVASFTSRVDTGPGEAVLMKDGAELLKKLVSGTEWLAPELRASGSDPYRQYLLYCDPAERFSVVCFVWAPGQGTPVHDHGVWGLVGVLEGAELSQHYEVTDQGLVASGECERLEAGCVASVSPSTADIHQVTNALDDRSSISIHVYGANIGRRSRRSYAPDGQSRTFVSGYANAQLPAPWNAVAGL
jgi:predicted metal-dependent enzyme (double-stranded beta helix superfamily)